MIVTGCGLQAVSCCRNNSAGFVRLNFSALGADCALLSLISEVSSSREIVTDNLIQEAHARNSCDGGLDVRSTYQFPGRESSYRHDCIR